MVVALRVSFPLARPLLARPCAGDGGTGGFPGAGAAARVAGCAVALAPPVGADPAAAARALPVAGAALAFGWVVVVLAVLRCVFAFGLVAGADFADAVLVVMREGDVVRVAGVGFDPAEAGFAPRLATAFVFAAAVDLDFDPPLLPADAAIAGL
jgi:hypothetical protein